MSEVDTRPATRGRSSHRGGRGGFGRGGPRGGRKQVNGASSHDAPAIEEILADEGELGDMKRQYATELPTLKELFPDWTDVDLIFALQESDGDMTATIEKISQGNVSQFSEVKKVKDRARSKVKEEPASTEKTVSGRGGRGRGGLEGSRGRGGRASDRGRGGHRGGRGGHATTETSTKDSNWASVPTTESPAWSKEPNAETSGVTESAGWGEESKAAAAESKTETATEPAQESSGPVAAIKKTWASMFASKPAAPAPKESEKPLEKPTNAEPQPSIDITTAPEAETTEPILTDATKPAILASAIIADNQAAEVQTPEIPPSTVPLTEENVEHLPDESHPPATQTVASTVGSNDPRNLTPLPPTQQPPIARPQLGGFATSAHRAASGSFRSASYQRRVQEQQESVVMPGHNAVDRAAVQFGSMGLNDSSELDVDDEREEIETRQAPQHSPPSQPKTSLPPAAKSGVADVGLAEALPTKQAPGLPPASQQNQPSSLNQETPQDQSQLGYQQNQYGNYAQSGLQQDAQQKQYDPFAHQTQHPQYDRFGSQHQGQQQQPQSQHQSHSGFGGLGSAPHDYNSSYYGSEAQRNAYGQYYGGNNQYAGHDGRSQAQQQDTSVGQQRSASQYGSAPNESGFGSQQPQQTQARYGEAANSGHSTPNPQAVGQQGNNAQQQSAMHHQATQQQRDAYAAAAAAGFPYGHPYFNSPYQQAYQNQFGYSQYGQGYPSKQGYNAPYGQQMGSQPSYDQHSTSGASGAFSQSQGQPSTMRTASGMSSSLGGGLDEYGRSTSQSQTGSGFGGINDPFGRSQSGYSQGSYNAQTSTAGPEDALKPYADQKAGSSPSLGQPGRPASAANNQANTSQQQSQGGFGGYQGFQGQSGQYAGLGGLGGHQQGQANQQGGYSGYNANAFAQYGSYNNRGGWGQSYGTH